MEHAIYSILFSGGICNNPVEGQQAGKGSSRDYEIDGSGSEEAWYRGTCDSGKRASEQRNIGNIAKKLDLGIAVFLRTYGMLEEEKTSGSSVSEISQDRDDTIELE